MNRRTALQCLLMGLAMPYVPSNPWGSPLLASPAYGAAREQLALNMAVLYDKLHPVSHNVLRPWAQEMLYKSQQHVNITLLSADELGSDAEMYSSILLDMTSMGTICPNAIVPPLPVSSLLDYPLLFSSSQLGSLVSWAMLQRQPALQRELHDVHILSSWVSGPIYLHTIHKPVCTLADIKGMNLIAWSPLNSAMIQQLGGTPIMMIPHDSQKMLARSAVDGILCPFPPLQSFNLAPLIRYTTELPLNTMSFILAMNKDVWSILPTAVQDVFTATTGARMSQACGRQLDAESTSARQRMHKNGHIFVQPTQQATHDCTELFSTMLRQEEQRLVHSGIPDVAGFTDTLLHCRDTTATHLA